MASRIHGDTLGDREDLIRLQKAILASIQEGDAVGAGEAAARHLAYMDDLLRRSL
ncbi:MAG: hypothetical protein PVH41_02115 [Anaerolineae bacterium]